MKITRFLLVLFLFLNNNLFAQLQLLNTREIDVLNDLEKGKNIIKKNTISESFEYTHKIDSKDSILSSHKTYNKNGYLLTETDFSLKLDTIRHNTYKYDGNKLIKTDRYFKNENNIRFHTSESFNYDDKGNNIETQLTNIYNEMIYKKIDYDNNNLKIAQNTKLPGKSELSIKKKYFYSKENTLIKEKEYQPDGTLSYEIKYKYNNTGNLIRSNIYLNGLTEDTYIYSYDKNNNQIESDLKFLVDGKPYLYKTKYEYDINNNLVKKSNIKNNTLTSFETFIYKKFE